KYTLSNSDRIIATTETYAATSRSVWNTNPIVIPNAVDCKRFNPSVDSKNVRKRFGLENSDVVLYVGRLVHHKGLEYLIESAKYGDKNTKYLIVGDGPYRGKLEEIVRRLKIQNRILFIGKVSNKDLPYYFSACDVFVLPSVSRLEAFGLVALEAMATEKPVVVSNIPGVREVITEGVEGLHAEPMNAKDIAEKIKIILRDKELAKKMGKEGRKKVEEKFKWEMVAERIEAVYEDVLKGKRE
ncbi:MAG: glycosyltransferase family 4 protein, partial [Thermoplasmata archaeon]